jgi:hypothetical protein
VFAPPPPTTSAAAHPPRRAKTPERRNGARHAGATPSASAEPSDGGAAAAVDETESEQHDNVSVLDAQSAVARVSRREMTELKHMAHPPPAVVAVLEAVLVLLGASPPLEWRDIKLAISRPAFLEQVQAVRRTGDVPSRTKAAVRQCLEREALTYERVRKSSHACAALYLLAKACAAADDDDHHENGDSDGHNEDDGSGPGSAPPQPDFASSSVAGPASTSIGAAQDATTPIARPVITAKTAAEVVRAKRARQEAVAAAAAATAAVADAAKEKGDTVAPSSSSASVVVPDESDEDVDEEDAGGADANEGETTGPVTMDVELLQGPGDKLGFSVREGYVEHAPCPCATVGKVGVVVWNGCLEVVVCTFS